jgi:hypothetical protein
MFNEQSRTLKLGSGNQPKAARKYESGRGVVYEHLLQFIRKLVSRQRIGSRKSGLRSSEISARHQRSRYARHTPHLFPRRAAHRPCFTSLVDNVQLREYLQQTKEGRRW